MTPEDLCPCDPMPVNYMYRQGQLMGTATIDADTADQDARIYNSLGCDGWVIQCPECGRVYAHGVTWGETQ